MSKKSTVFGYYLVSKELQARFHNLSVFDLIMDLSARSWLVWDEPDNLEDRVLILQAKNADDEDRVKDLIGLLFNVLDVATSFDIEDSFEWKKTPPGVTE